MLTPAKAEVLLAQAFEALFNFVVAMHISGKKERDAPVFSLLLAPKQIDEVNRVCDANNWPKITTHGIEINVQAVRHALEARRHKDQISDEEILEILTKAYHPRSLVRSNRNDGNRVQHERQSLLFNTHQKVKVGNTMFHGLAVLQLKTEGARTYLAPVTCYHATEAKIRAIKKHS